MEQKILDGEIGRDLLLSDFQGEQSVLINSPGGSLFAGLAMYDYVQGNDIEVGVIGVSASAATLPLIASEKRWGTPNSRYLIHNPHTISIGDAEAMSKTAKDLRVEQERALNLYVQHLNGTAEELQALMNEERVIDADEALQLGLIKEIRQINDESEKPEGTDINNLFTQFKMKYEMKEDDKKELSGLSAKIDELKNQIQNFFSPKMLVVQDVNGMEIDFGDAIETAEQIAVGAEGVTVDGSPAAGEYVLPSGEVYVFESGTLTEIKPVEEEETEDVEALKAENERLTKELADVQNKLDTTVTEKDELTTKFNDVSTQFDTVKNEFTEFKGKFSKEKPEDNLPENNQDEVKKFSYKK